MVLQGGHNVIEWKRQMTRTKDEQMIKKTTNPSVPFPSNTSPLCLPTYSPACPTNEFFESDEKINENR